MRIYNYLFYKSYQLAIKSGNFNDLPALGGSLFVVVCSMFNIFTIFLLLEGFGVAEFIFDKKYKVPFALFLTLLILFYYLYKGRHKRIIKKFEDWERRTRIGLHPVLVIFIYYVTSFLSMLLAGMFKNKDWIFSN